MLSTIFEKLPPADNMCAPLQSALHLSSLYLFAAVVCMYASCSSSMLVLAEMCQSSSIMLVESIGKSDCKFQALDLLFLFIMPTNFISEEEKEGKA